MNNSIRPTNDIIESQRSLWEEVLGTMQTDITTPLSRCELDNPAERVLLNTEIFLKRVPRSFLILKEAS